MLDGVTVLIVEDEALVAFEIAESVILDGGQVLGPVASVREALTLVETAAFDAAILDSNLVDRNITPVLAILLARGTPLVLHTGLGLPAEMSAYESMVSVLRKPASPDALLASLSSQLASQHPANAATPTR
jgi:CheY-like chemotaxis protein